MGIEVIDIAANPDHVHLFIKYSPKYSVSYIAKILKVKSSIVMKKEFPELKKWCRDNLWALTWICRTRLGCGDELFIN